jgi:hypothetical protein
MLIGITGKAGSGKSTLAQAIIDRSHTPGGVLAFADAVRDVSQAIFGSRYESQEEKAALDGWWAARIGTLGDRAPTGRVILQVIGTEMGRNVIHRDIWLFVMERRLATLDPGRLATWVIADVRFDNEAEWIRARGGYVVEVSRGLPPSGDAHASEAGVSPRLVNEFITLRTLDDTRRAAEYLAAGRPSEVTHG